MSKWMFVCQDEGAQPCYRDMEEQKLCSEPVLDVQAPHPISKAEPQPPCKGS